MALPPSARGYRGAVLAETIVGGAATVSAVAFSWPQVVRGWRTDSVEGVAPRTFLQTACGSSLWTAYGAAIGDVPLVVANSSIVLAALLVLLLCVRHGRIRTVEIAAALAGTAALGWVAAARSDVALGLASLCVGTPAIIPQTWRVWRTERLYGVSAVMYATLAACCACWFAYGVMIGDAFVALPNVVGITCASYIAWRAHDSHRRYASLTSAEATPQRG